MAMEKKATVRDIAAKAGVSVATVSYVLNDKEGTKISDATRKKVLQVANLLNYSIPDKYKNVGTEKNTYSIGIIYSLKEDTPSRNTEIMYLISLLAERFERMKFNCLLLPIESGQEKYEPIQGLDGIIAIDLDEKDFKRMSGNYYIPILCLDMMINDFLFYQIHTDMETIISSAKEVLGNDFYLITDRYSNEGYQEYITSSMPKGKVLNFSDIDQKKLSSLKEKKLLVFGTYLGLIMKQYTDSDNIVIVSGAYPSHPAVDVAGSIHNDLNKKANLAMNIMMNALEKKFDIKHEYKIC